MGVDKEEEDSSEKGKHKKMMYKHGNGVVSLPNLISRLLDVEARYSHC